MQSFYEKILGLIQSYEDVRHFWDQSSPFVLNKMFWYKPLLLHLPIVPFHCAQFKKILTTDPELWRCIIFGPKVLHLPKQFWGRGIITIILIYLLAPFIVQNFKKILPADPEL